MDKWGGGIDHDGLGTLLFSTRTTREEVVASWS